MNYSWEWHPSYQPLDPAEQEMRLERWAKNKRIESVAVPVATLTIPEPDLEFLAQEAVDAPRPYSMGNLQGYLGNRRKGKNNELVHCLGRSLGLLRKVVVADLESSGANLYRVGTSSLRLENYERNESADMWHCDAEVSAPLRHADVKYVVTPLGPSTVFGQGKFKRTAFDDEGDYLRPRRKLHTYQPPSGTVMRFDSMTMHAAPKLPSGPRPRLFVSLVAKPADGRR